MIQLNLKALPKFQAPYLLAFASATGVEWERADANAIVARAAVDRHMHVRLPRTSSDVAIEDWDDLFRAVTARLAQTFDTPVAATKLVRFRVSVLECVEALEQLRTTMTHELSRLQQIRGQKDGMAAA
jgi:hypothetical protein